MMITRPLLVLAFTLIALTLPVGTAHGGSQWPADAAVDELPPDLPPWLVASRLGRQLDDPARDDVSGLRAPGAVPLPATPARIEPDPLTLRTSTRADSTDLRALLGRSERWQLMRFGAVAGSPQEVKVTAFGSVAYLPRTLMAARP